MFEFINHIHSWPEFKVGKPDALSRCSEKDLKALKLEGIDVVTWDKKNWLWVVLIELRLQVLYKYHDS